MFTVLNNYYKKILKNNIWQAVIVAFILIIFLVINISLAKSDSITSDEPVHIGAGYNYSIGNYWHNYEHPPLINYLSGAFVNIFTDTKALNNGAIEQYTYGDMLIFQFNQNSQDIIFYARLPVILLSVLLAVFVYIWSKKLWGFLGGILSLILYIFCPNILAHGHLATTDLGSVLFPFVSMYLIYLAYTKINIKRSVWIGILAGLTLAAKFSGIIIVPVIILFYLIFLIIKKIDIKKFFLYLFISASIAAFILWFSYIISIFNQLSFHPEPYTMLAIFKDMKVTKWYTQIFLIPLDYYWQGLMFVKKHAEVGHTAFLDGQFNQYGWWYYFPLSFWYKTLLPNMILFTASLIAMLKYHKKFIVELTIFLLPLGYLIISLNTKINIGVRHILLFYPFIFLSIGRLTKVDIKSKILKIIYIVFIVSILGWAIVESISYYPSYIAYFNQIAGGGDGGYKHLSDSNLDWGQDISRVDEYMNKNEYKDYLLLRCEDKSTYSYYNTKNHKIGDPVLNQPEYIAIQYFCYQMSANSDDKLFKTIKDKEPIDKIGYSIFIYKNEL